MANRKKSSGVEWIGGLAAMPGYVTNEGEPYRPELLLWMSAEGAIVGNALGTPGEMLAVASENLRQTTARPMVGPPHTPARVRVASAELAAVLRAGHPALDVVCAPTPELDAVLATMREHMTHDGDEEESYLADGNSADAVGALFRAAASFYRAQPWKVVPGGRCLFSVSIAGIDVRGSVVSVIGQMEESFGFVVFASLEDFDRYGEAAAAVERGEKPELPSHFALNFERGADLAPQLRKEIAAHAWEVAAADAYPWLVAIDPDLIARPPSKKELMLTEAICLALPEVLRDQKKLRDAWQTGNAYEKTVTVHTHAGEHQVIVRAPHEDEMSEDEDEMSEDEDEMSEDEDEMSEDEDELTEAIRAADEALARRFAESPEGKPLGEGRHAGLMVIDFANDYFGASVTMLRGSELREILFDLIPRKVMAEPEAASEMVTELRAFYTFLKRDLVLPQADECLRVLGDGAASKLRTALSDPSKFGMAKSMMAAGRDAGFDIHTKEGIDAWMRELQSKPLPPSISLPWPDARTNGAAKRAKKDKRKAARKARKKSR